MNKDILQHLSKDPIIKKLMGLHSLAKTGNNRTVEQELCASIISQQLSVKAAATIYQRFLDLFPNKMFDGQYLLALDHSLLRGAGLSNNKANYVKNVVHFFEQEGLRNEQWENHSDEHIINTLTEIKGVGVWTVQMLLMFKLGRQDVFPINDLGIRQGMIRLYGLTQEKKALTLELIQIADKWKPYRSYASRLVWESLA